MEHFVTKRDLSKITGKVCALTFDDGPSDATEKVLDLLQQYGCTASFFVVGRYIHTKEQIETMRRAMSLGCTIENHSWSHVNMRQMTREQVLEEFSKNQEMIYENVGEYPVFFRAPGLAISELMVDTIPLHFANGRGGSADWNSNPDDPVTSDLETRVKGYLSGNEDGLIKLMHDCARNHLTPEALAIALPKLLDEGYSFVNLRELFTIKGQPLTPVPGGKKVWTVVEQR